VLSACQTGAGELTQDGIIGLVRAFLAAGARTVIVTLWNANQDSGGRLLALFYKNLLHRIDNSLQTGEGHVIDIAEVMQNSTQDFIKNRPAFAIPSHWASFVVYGAATLMSQ